MSQIIAIRTDKFEFINGLNMHEKDTSTLMPIMKTKVGLLSGMVALMGDLRDETWRFALVEPGAKITDFMAAAARSDVRSTINKSKRSSYSQDINHIYSEAEDIAKKARHSYYRTGRISKISSGAGGVIRGKIRADDPGWQVIYNKDKDEYLDPTDFSDDTSDWRDFSFSISNSSINILSSLAVLLYVAPENSNTSPFDMNNILVGSWAGDSLSIIDESELKSRKSLAGKTVPILNKAGLT